MPENTPDSVVVEIEIAAPAERVFQALVEQKELFQWWGAEPSVDLIAFEMSPHKGGSWRYECTSRAGHDHGEIEKQMRTTGGKSFQAHGEVVEMIPPKLLVWSWIANWHDRPEQRTEVRWELEPTKTGMRVRVRHSGLAQQPTARKDYGSGWVGVLELLRKFLEAAS